jgi:hypothetical protein
VYSDEFTVDNTRDWDIIEGFHDDFVDFLIVFTEAFSTEVEERSHLSAFVIATQHVYRLWEIYLD